LPVESGNQRPRALLDEARRRERWSEKADPAADAREGRGCDKRRPAREHPASAPSIAKIMARRAAVAACKAAEHDQREGEGRRRSARWSDGPRQNRFGFVWRHDRTDIEIDCTRMYLGGRAPKPRYRELLPDEASEPGPGPRRITSDQSTPRARLDLEPPVPRVEYFGRLGTKARASLSHDLSVVRRGGNPPPTIGGSTKRRARLEVFLSPVAVGNGAHGSPLPFGSRLGRASLRSRHRRFSASTPP
jgi:hypothetical protein